MEEDNGRAFAFVPNVQPHALDLEEARVRIGMPRDELFGIAVRQAKILTADEEQRGEQDNRPGATHTHLRCVYLALSPTKGLVRRSWPKVEAGPCPGRN